MAGRIGIVQIGHPGPRDGAGDDYWTTGLGARLAGLYGELLGLRHIYIGYHKLVHEDGRTPEIGFEYAPADPPPQWPDPNHPQQVHLDIAVADMDAAEQLVVSHGAEAAARRRRAPGLRRPVRSPVLPLPGRRPRGGGRSDRSHRVRLLQSALVGGVL